MLLNALLDTSPVNSVPQIANLNHFRLMRFAGNGSPCSKNPFIIDKIPGLENNLHVRPVICTILNTNTVAVIIFHFHTIFSKTETNASKLKPSVSFKPQLTNRSLMNLFGICTMLFLTSTVKSSNVPTLLNSRSKYS